MESDLTRPGSAGVRAGKRIGGRAMRRLEPLAHTETERDEGETSKRSRSDSEARRGEKTPAGSRARDRDESGSERKG
ncbi:Hypothetical protein NTJ_02241 [Nesidiocoris tenuis]|uniref:Uncharacterized protein n=1 Tax=Nesidiocoris tenuis TaxID=355587 RepID=A0ABN7ADK4_9HEMI|nr:Hypothetical protein NTJ_02241 [Nesidiocoris tenuis]